MVLSFLENINFLCRFIANSVKLLKSIISMLRKNNKVRWTLEAHASFENIKKSIMEGSVLEIPYFSKEFQVFSIFSEHTIVVVLLQKNEEGHEQPIAFFSCTLRDAELKYIIIEKHAYSIVKDFKAFRECVFHSKMIAYMPLTAVTEILTQPNRNGRQGKWIEKL